jgi:[ribosomal protein S5]-alanine N-acetyltransferase
MNATPSPRWHNAQIELFVLEPEHVSEDYVAWLNDPAINQYLESRFVTHTLASTRAFVAACRNSANSLMLGIRSREHANRHVGNIKLGPIDLQHGLGEIGILIGDRQAWGRGVGRQAIAALCEIAHHELGLRKLTAGCYASNTGSERAFIAAGFHVEGRRGQHFLVDGQPEDLVLLARHTVWGASHQGPI